MDASHGTERRFDRDGAAVARSGPPGTWFRAEAPGSSRAQGDSSPVTLPQDLLGRLINRARLARSRGDQQSPPKFSHLDEETVLRRFLHHLGTAEKCAVDIGASDGVTMSNTLALFRDGWKGLAVEPDGGRFARLAMAHAELDTALARAKVTPLNVTHLLRAYDVPEDFTFLSLDIDGYDYFVLEALLDAFRPKLICAEINEKIPPPLEFTIRWDPEFAWAGDHFYGQSIAQLGQLVAASGYDLLELHYNNAFLAPRELGLGPPLTPDEAYQQGYVGQPDRREKFPWNADVDHVLEMDPPEAETFFLAFFERYEGRFELTRPH